MGLSMWLPFLWFQLHGFDGTYYDNNDKIKQFLFEFIIFTT